MSDWKRFSKFLGQWGPYSKKYMGISRIVDEDRKAGVRFDCAVHPTIANSNVPVPNVTVPSNYHPWSCNKDFSHFSYRYDLEWKDKVYADVSFTKLEEEAYLIRTEFVNHSEMNQNCLLNYFSALEYPFPYSTQLEKPLKCQVWDAADYQAYQYAVKRPWDEENPDGMKKGMFLDPDFWGGRGLGDRVENDHVHFLKLKPFGAVKGDMVSYKILVEEGYQEAVLNIRYRTVTEGDGSFLWGGKTLLLPQTGGEFAFARLPLGHLEAGALELRLESTGGAGVELDFLALTEAGDTERLKAVRHEYERRPEISAAEHPWGKEVKLFYKEAGKTFRLLTNNPKTRLREINSGCLEDALISRLSNGDETFDWVTRTFTNSFCEKKSDPGFYQNTLVHSIYIPSGGSHIEYAVICMDDFKPESNEAYEAAYQAGRATLEPLRLNKAGEPYAFSNELLKATALTNTVYPIYRHGEYIVHHTPGKRWDCLYTWDSGFIGLGLLEAEPKLAEYILDTYLSEAENPDFAFLHHGSPVPVQFYLYLEMLKRDNEKEGLLAYYDRMKLYYDFMAGKIRGSTTGKFKSGLTTTYDYFYSSSGMDDYPAQHEMIARKLEQYACPCISTSQIIRCAKLLCMAARQLGKETDAAELREDIERFKNALQKTAWDEDAGYFSYVLHNEKGEPEEFFRTPDGENLNKGMDGVYPLIAGACTQSQRSRILGHLKNPNEMLTPVGISAVDRSASYYRDNGYWNGNVWFSHQWFLWKTMLDLGEADFAFQIADIALNVWKKEVEHSYYTFEMIHIETGRGGWFHHFGGLSMPVNIWANAYYKPGTLTTGLDVWVDSQSWLGEHTALEAKLKYYGENAAYTVLAVLDDTYEYTVTVNGRPANFSQRRKGVYEITLDGKEKEAQIKIMKQEFIQ